METVKALAEKLGILDSHFGVALVGTDGWITMKFVGMPEPVGDSLYGPTHETPQCYLHGCHPIWALIHAAKRQPTAGSSVSRQAGWKRCDAWFFVPVDCAQFAEQYAVPTRISIEGTETKAIQIMLQISTR
jgi:hypothetical protein